MGAVLEHAFTDKGIPALGIWAQVPHYVSAMSYPAATAGAARRAARGRRTGHRCGAPIRQDTIIQRQRLDQLVADNDEHGAMVAQLEELYDANSDTDLTRRRRSRCPTGDELAAEFEQFLRDQDT